MTEELIDRARSAQKNGLHDGWQEETGSLIGELADALIAAQALTRHQGERLSSEGPSDGQRIVDGLQDALDGNVTRVTRVALASQPSTGQDGVEWIANRAGELLWDWWSSQFEEEIPYSMADDMSVKCCEFIAAAIEENPSALSAAPAPSVSGAKKMSLESWKPIPGWDAYEVSDLGQVRRGDKVLRQATDSRGYKRVGLSIAGRKKTSSVHRLVMRAFRGPCPDGLQVAHLDGKPPNNRLDNLMYATPKENSSHKIAHGTHLQGLSANNTKLTPAHAVLIKELFCVGWKVRELSSAFNVTSATAYRAVKGKHWAIAADANSDLRRVLPTAICADCGNSFEAVRRYQRFCGGRGKGRHRCHGPAKPRLAALAQQTGEG